MSQRGADILVLLLYTYIFYYLFSENVSPPVDLARGGFHEVVHMGGTADCDDAAVHIGTILFMRRYTHVHRKIDFRVFLFQAARPYSRSTRKKPFIQP